MGEFSSGLIQCSRAEFKYKFICPAWLQESLSSSELCSHSCTTAELGLSLQPRLGFVQPKWGFSVSEKRELSRENCSARHLPV
jgi:hypothetical protein